MARPSDGIAPTILRLLASRGLMQTICPSEVARAITPHHTGAPDAWRAHMADVRAFVVRMAARGEVVVMQRGRAVDTMTARGPIRIGPVRGRGR
ncbi:MAG: DUF3253 domain-containing protein [Candidatus Binatia bacterium]